MLAGKAQEAGEEAKGPEVRETRGHGGQHYIPRHNKITFLKNKIKMKVLFKKEKKKWI